MPLQSLINYWNNAGPLALPYFNNRKIGLEQKFNEKIIFRRHNADKKWIYIKNQSDIYHWVNLHTWSFHPHQLSDKNELTILIDIDKRSDKMPFKYIIAVTKMMADLLINDHQEFLLKYSGNRGFHFLWSLGKIKQTDIDSGKIYQYEHQIIEKYTAQLEESVQYSDLKKKLAKYHQPGTPVFTTNSADKKQTHCILIDKNILHPNGLFRSPWSVHPVTSLVSAPLTVENLAGFDPQDFHLEKMIYQIKIANK